MALAAHPLAARQPSIEHQTVTNTQRRVHLALWLVLGPAVLVGLVLALTLRPVVPAQADPGLAATGPEPSP